MKKKSRIVFLLFFLLVNQSWAVEQVKLPPSLSPWADWVLFGSEKSLCPSVYNDFNDHKCLWPEKLDLVLTDLGGSFHQKWTILEETWIPLPGGTTHWPGDVHIGTSLPAVVMHDGSPSILADKGVYSISGKFVWAKLPQSIGIPPGTGRVELTVNGLTKPAPFVDSHNKVWVQERIKPENKETSDMTRIKIYRLMEDSHPFKITTRINLTVSGRVRREKIISPLLAASEPVSVSSPLPVKLTKDQDLWVEVKPGRWNIDILSIINEPVSKLGPALAPFGEELWAVKPVPRLRAIDVKGLTPIDPSQTTMPYEWRKYLTFLVKSGDILELKERKRGGGFENDSLELKRDIWLDFNGRGSIVLDQLSGQLGKREFLGIDGRSFNLGRISSRGRDQLVTIGKNGLLGMEMEKGPVNIRAVSRTDKAKNFPMGWNTKFRSDRMRLHLPPGYRLLAAKGADVPGRQAWVDKWSLLDFFMVLIISLAVSKIGNPRWGLVFFLGLVLIWHESFCPRLVWVNLLVTTALLKFAKGGMEQGRWRKLHVIAVRAWYITALVFLAVSGLFFSWTQIRSAIYPQLEPRGMVYQKNDMESDNVMVRSPMESLKVKAGRKMDMKKLENTSMYERDKNYTLAMDKAQVTQTGPGLPNWTWKTIQMRSGPVSGNHSITLWITGITANSILSLLRVFFLLALASFFLKTRPLFTRGLQKSKALPFALIAVVFFSFFHSSPAMAQFPSQNLLKELKARLLKADDCFPRCAAISSMDITPEHKGVDITFNVSAAVKTAVPLPNGQGSWVLRNLMLDQKTTSAVLRDGKFLWILVPKGKHIVKLSGLSTTPGKLNFGFQLKPGYINVKAAGWDVTGLDENNQVENELKIVSKVDENPKDSSLFSNTNSYLTNFLIIRRTLFLGMEWKIITRVERLVNYEGQGSISKWIPLLKGEMVRTGGVRIERNEVDIEMGPDQNMVEWQSSLPISSSLTLGFPEKQSWSEIWKIQASPLWQYSFKGVPATYDGKSGTTWVPWPGESLAVSVSKLKAAPGSSTTIDWVKADYHLGEGYNRIRLLAKVRTTRGGNYPVAGPENGVLKYLKINNRKLPISTVSGKVMVPLRPGSQKIEMEWHQPVKQGPGMILGLFLPKKITFPRIDLGQNLSNLDIFFHLPAKFWLFQTRGPLLGPAVLIWGYLVLIIFAALLLGKYAPSPLSTRDWLLLGMGLVTLGPISLVVAVAWFPAMEARKNKIVQSNILFNLTQTGLAFWTIAAGIILYQAVSRGFLGIPDMQIAGNQSTQKLLHWTCDRSGSTMPRPEIIVSSIYLFRALMFFWALWLAGKLIPWSVWAYNSFRQGGAFRKMRKPRKETLSDKARRGE